MSYRRTRLGSRSLVVFPVTNAWSHSSRSAGSARGAWKTTRLTEEERQVVKVTEETIKEEGIR